MVLTAENFLSIKRFILGRGGRRTYCNMYNDNPHYEFPGFHAYLHPDVGQRNINCDPHLSDFDELVIQDGRTDERYFGVKVSDEKDTLEYSEGHRGFLEAYFRAMLSAAGRE